MKRSDLAFTSKGGRTVPPPSTKGCTFGWIGIVPIPGTGPGWLRFPDTVTLGDGASPRLVRRLSIPLSDMLSRAVTGGIRTRADGRRFTSDFMSDSNSSSWFSTANTNSICYKSDIQYYTIIITKTTQHTLSGQPTT